MIRLPNLLLAILFPFLSFAQFGEPERISMPIAFGASTIVEADLDGDGDLDMLSGSEYDGRIAWYNNDGTGHFTAEKDIVTSTGYTYVSDIVAADMDGDGDLDIVYSAKSINQIALIPNLGNGEFGIRQLITTSINGPEELALLDADNDGDLDIACAFSSAYTVLLIKNNGGFNFSSQTSHSCNSQPKSIKATDIDGDGDKDLAVMTSTNIYKYINTGGVFSPAVSVLTNSYAYSSFGFGDVNNDGHQDIVTGSFSGTFIQWQANDGNGSFGAAQTISTTNQIRNVFPADMDNDGDLDVAAVMEQSIKWYENTGTTTFSEHIIENVRGTQLLITDIDGDGDADVMSASHDDYVVRCNLRENGAFQPSFLLAGGTKLARSLAHADIDGDGDMDVIAASGPIVSWFPNNGDGNFGAQHPIIAAAADRGFSKVIAEDIDNDGDVDVLACDEAYDQMYKALNDGSGNFTYIFFGNSYSSVKRMMLSDYDADGDKDIFVGGPGCIMLKNNGNGYATTAILSSSNAVREIALIDMNGDSRLDLLYATNKVAYRAANVNGTFSSSESLLLSNQNFWDVKFVDLDQDGILDILCGYSSSGTIGWRKGNPSGTGWGAFIPLGDPLTLNSSSQIEVADVDNDGDLDFFFIHGSHQVNYYEHVGNMQFILHPIANLGDVNDLDFYDFDGDGDQDLFAAADDVVEVAKNQLHAPYQAKGTLFLDNNQNGVKDVDDVGLKLVKVASNPQAHFAFSGHDGTYYLNFDDTPGTYSLSPQVNSNWSITTTPPMHTVNVSGPALLLDTLDFGLYPSTQQDSVVSTLTGGFPRCNNVVNYYLNVGNRGSSIASGIFSLQLDPEIQFVSAAIPPDSTNGQLLYWHFDSIFYFSDEKLLVQVQMPDFNSMGNSLNSVLVATVYDASGNATHTSTDTLSQTLVCAYDPNDKAVIPVGTGPEGIIPTQTPYLDYFVRFQNTGNDTAVTVVVRDILDANLDHFGLQPIASSHPMEINIDADGEIAFVFDHIMLPDSNTNESASHGFVRFRVPFESNLPSGTVIRNQAKIYFDANPAVETNTTINTLVPIASYSSISVEECDEYTSPSEQYTWTTSGTYSDTIPNLYGADSIITIHLTILLPSFSSISEEACTAYTSPSGETWTASGIYTDTIPNAAMCDSIITVNLTIIHATATLLDHATIEAQSTASAAYQWVDCENGYSAIPGATDQLFTPEENGSYAVIATGNSCSDTSACIIVSELLVPTNSNLGTLVLAPNPTDGKFTIMNQNGIITGWELISTSGQYIDSQEIEAGSSTEVSISGKSGLYFVIVSCQDGTRTCLPVIKH